MILPYRGKGNLLILGRPCGMEMHQGQRPVYGGAPRMGVKNRPRNDTVRGVQGSRGPLVGGRRIETAGPLVLSVMKEQHSNEKLSKRWPPSQPGK